MNYKPSKFYWVVILLFFFNSVSFAQNKPVTIDSATAIAGADPVPGEYENIPDTLITQTDFAGAGDSISKWKYSRDFEYMAYLDSLLRKKTGLRIDTVSIDKGVISKTSTTPGAATGNTSDSFLNSFPVKIFFWIAAVFFIGFILYKLFFTGALFAKGTPKAGDEIANEEPGTLDEYSQYDLLIYEAELKNDFNLSIRYLYLQVLKKLSDEELIVFSADKTNDLYVRELSHHTYRHEFLSLATSYEYIWYGRFAIDKTRYQQLKEKFISFNKKI